MKIKWRKKTMKKILEDLKAKINSEDEKFKRFIKKIKKELYRCRKNIVESFKS